MATPRSMITQAKALYQEQTGSSTSKPELAAMSLLMAGHYEQVIALLGAVKALSEEGKNTLIWAYIEHGNALVDQAKTKSGEGADRLFEAAAEKYAQALAIKPDMHEALDNWGNALGAQAKTKSGEDADLLFEAAAEKYAQALAIKPDKHEALNNWGATLGAQAKTKSGDMRHDLIRRAIEFLSQAETAGYKEVYYNLACMHALGSDEEATERYLLAAKEHGTLPDRAFIEDDPDFSEVRNQDWFVRFLDEL